MINILKIDEWIKLQNCDAQFFFIDPEITFVAERIEDGFVFFIGDEVSYFGRSMNLIKTHIKSFDTISFTLVNMSNGDIIPIDEIEKTERFDTANSF